jgi:hypothetical protein
MRRLSEAKNSSTVWRVLFCPRLIDGSDLIFAVGDRGLSPGRLAGESGSAGAPWADSLATP